MPVLETPEEIRRQGLDALQERLGRAGMLRFLQQFDRGEGDYARERHAWVDSMTLTDIQNELESLRKGGSDSTRRSRKKS